MGILSDESNQPEEWNDKVSENETSQEEKLIQKEGVPDTDVFKLGKNILLACSILFVLLTCGYVTSACWQGKEEMKQVWTFASQAIYGIVTLILGLYFGGSKNRRV